MASWIGNHVHEYSARNYFCVGFANFNIQTIENRQAYGLQQLFDIMHEVAGIDTIQSLSNNSG